MFDFFNNASLVPEIALIHYKQNIQEAATMELFLIVEHENMLKIFSAFVNSKNCLNCK